MNLCPRTQRNLWPLSRQFHHDWTRRKHWSTEIIFRLFIAVQMTNISMHTLCSPGASSNDTDTAALANLVQFTVFWGYLPTSTEYSISPDIFTGLLNISSTCFRVSTVFLKNTPPGGEKNQIMKMHKKTVVKGAKVVSVLRFCTAVCKSLAKIKPCFTGREIADVFSLFHQTTKAIMSSFPCCQASCKSLRQPCDWVTPWVSHLPVKSHLLAWSLLHSSLGSRPFLTLYPYLR